VTGPKKRKPIIGEFMKVGREFHVLGIGFFGKSNQ
jgi:hypothetical protein